MARNDPQVNFRIPADLKQRLEAEAEKNNRSFKAEIEYRLDNWEGAVEQIDLTHKGWEQARIKLDSQRELIEALQAELHEAIARGETLEDRFAEHRLDYREKLAEAERLKKHWHDEAKSLRASNDRLRAERATDEAMQRVEGNRHLSFDELARRWSSLPPDKRPKVSESLGQVLDTWLEVGALVESISADDAVTPTSTLAVDIKGIMEFMAARPDDAVGSIAKQVHLQTALGKDLAAAIDEYGQGLMVSMVSWMKMQGYIDATAETALFDDDEVPVKKAV